MNSAVLPAFERLSRTRHGAIPLENRAEILRQAELVSIFPFLFTNFLFKQCPGIMDSLMEEILKRVTHPQTSPAEIQAALARLSR
jgi:hypothetical protein